MIDSDSEAARIDGYARTSGPRRPFLRGRNHASPR
jgi:hypothetical protein